MIYKMIYNMIYKMIYDMIYIYIDTWSFSKLMDLAMCHLMSCVQIWVIHSIVEPWPTPHHVIVQVSHEQKTLIG